MIKTTIRAALECSINAHEHYIYLVRDEDIALYVGLSTSPLDRLQEHLGFSAIGQALTRNLPGSLEWCYELYTLADCLSTVEQYLPASAGYYALHMRDTDALTQRELMHLAETVMIDCHQPCLNVAGIQYAKQVPLKYRRSKIANAGVKLG